MSPASRSVQSSQSTSHSYFEPITANNNNNTRTSNKAHSPFYCMGLLPFPFGTLRIMLVEFHERMAFYGVAYLLAVYITDMLQQSSETSNLVVNMFYLLSPLSAILGAVMADGVVGKAKVLAFGGTIYTTGIGILVLSAVPFMWVDFPDEPSRWSYVFFYAGITMLGSGYGMIKTVSAPLMAEQLPEDVPESVRARQTEELFNWLYWVINIGSVIGILLSPEIRNSTIGGPRRHNDTEGAYGTGFWLSFLITFGLSSLGLLVYISGLGSYKEVPLRKGTLSTALKLLFSRMRGMGDGAAEVLPCTMSSLDASNVAHDLDEAIDASKVFAFLPVFWLLSNQQSTNYIIQAKYLERPWFVPPEVLSVCSTMTMFFFIPFYNRVIVPRMTLSSIAKMVVGFLIASFGLGCAAIVQMEIERRGTIQDNGDYVLNPGQTRLAFWYQAPLYSIQSVSEVFAGVTAMRLAYSLAPASMRSVVMSFYLLSSAAGSALGLLITPISQPQNYLALFMGCACLMVLTSMLFYGMFNSYKLKEQVCYATSLRGSEADSERSRALSESLHH
eukprot:PhM_4_TR15465/c0_g1_i1/m.42371/K03305/TC.POT; proton-dependent oligopeptide transporter, POT family